MAQPIGEGMERSRDRGRLYSVVAAMVLMLSAFAGVGSAQNHNSAGQPGDQHCPDHETTPKVEASGGQADEVITVDGQDVRVIVNDDTVSFEDPDTGEPVTLEFCMRPRGATGVQTGSEGEVGGI